MKPTLEYLGVVNGSSHDARTTVSIGETVSFRITVTSDSEANFADLTGTYHGNVYVRYVVTGGILGEPITLDIELNETGSAFGYPPVSIAEGADIVFTAHTGTGDEYNPTTTAASVNTVTLHIGPSTSQPVTPASGRLEQFQNSAGTNIYPKTIMEGVVRQSDGKSLEEVLEEIETATGTPGPEGPTGPAGPGVPSGGSAGQILTKNSSGNYDTLWKTLAAYGTGDLTAGTSSLASGQIYLVYE